MSEQNRCDWLSVLGWGGATTMLCVCVCGALNARQTKQAAGLWSCVFYASRATCVCAQLYSQRVSPSSNRIAGPQPVGRLSLLLHARRSQAVKRAWKTTTVLGRVEHRPCFERAAADDDANVALAWRIGACVEPLDIGGRPRRSSSRPPRWHQPSPSPSSVSSSSPLQIFAPRTWCRRGSTTRPSTWRACGATSRCRGARCSSVTRRRTTSPTSTSVTHTARR